MSTPPVGLRGEIMPIFLVGLVGDVMLILLVGVCHCNGKHDG